MEKIILRQKWLGLMAVVLFSLFIAANISSSLKEAYVSAEPAIAQEINNFLPITFKNGEIVYPSDVIIERKFGPISYGADAASSQPYKIVLNTTVEDLNISDLTSGIYITRNKFYTYDAGKGEVKIQSLEKIPDTELTSADVKEFMESLNKYLRPISLLFIFVLFLIYIGISVLFYTVIMHWLFKKLYNADFALTLRVNTLAYLVLLGISYVIDVNFWFIIIALIMLACNYLANILLTDKK